MLKKPIDLGRMVSNIFEQSLTKEQAEEDNLRDVEGYPPKYEDDDFDFPSDEWENADEGKDTDSDHPDFED